MNRRSRLVVLGMMSQVFQLGCGHAGTDAGRDDGGDPADDPAERTSAWQSGARLRARVQDGGDGAALFVSWVDTKLGVDCTFVKAADGAFRCLPPPVRSSGVIFADPQCTRQVSFLSDPGDASGPNATAGGRKLFVRAPVGPCDEGPFTVKTSKGDPLFIDPFTREGDVCSTIGNPSFPVQVWVGELVDVDLSQFVAARETIDTSFAPLAARVLRGDDGSRENAGLFDMAHVASCVPVVSHAEPGALSTTCVSPDIALASATPPSCPQVVGRSTCATCPSAGFSVSTDLCKLDLELFSLTPGRPPGPADSCPKGSDGQTCPNLLAVADHTYPSVGVKRLGTGRLHVNLFADTRGRPVHNGPDPDPMSALGLFNLSPPNNVFFDQPLNANCVLQVDGPGAGRCLPTQIVQAYARSPNINGNIMSYSDPGCTTPIYVSSARVPIPCDGKMWVGTPDGLLYPLGPALQVDKVYTGGPGACVEDSAVDFLRTTSVPYSLGPVTMMSELAPLVERVE